MKWTLLMSITMSLTLLIGCASTNIVANSPTVAPITYQRNDESIQRSVGLLRRLATLPAKIDFTPEDSRLCLRGCEREQLRELPARAMDYLATWRGYETVSFDPPASSSAIADLTDQDIEERVARLADFAGQRSNDSAPEEVAQIARELGARMNVDGIVIIHGSVTSFSWVDAALMIPAGLSVYSFFAAIPIEMARIGSKIEADVFETASGQLVWTAVFSTSGNPLAPIPAANEIAEKLFDPIEPALPAVFTRPITTTAPPSSAALR